MKKITWLKFILLPSGKGYYKLKLQKEQVVLTSTILKRTGIEIVDYELLNKQRLVSHDDSKSTILLEEAEIRPCQKQ